MQEKTRNTRILKNFDRGRFDVLFQPLEEQNLCASLMAVLKTDFDGAKAEIIPATNISAAVVFDKYFEKKPPFGGKKKEEFPDAFVLTALEQWCAEKKKIYFISTDSDMESGCDDRGPLIHLKSMAEFVDLLLRADEDETDFLVQFFVDNPKQIVEAVSHGFEDRYLIFMTKMGTARHRSAMLIWAPRPS